MVRGWEGARKEEEKEGGKKGKEKVNSVVCWSLQNSTISFHIHIH